jgi:exopolysaccharide production protein ExoQ
MNMATNHTRKTTQQIIIYVLIALCFGFSLMPAGLDWVHVNPQGSYSEGSRLFQLQYGSIFLVAAIIVLRNQYWSLVHVRNMNPFLILFVLYCGLTMLWSPEPVVTLKRVIQLVGLITVGIAASPPIGYPRQLMDTLLGTFSILMFLSIIIVLMMPSVGIDTELNNAWRGIFSQKNALGAISALSAIFWVRQLFEKRMPFMMCAGGVLFSLLLLVMSKSTTALLVFMLCCGLYLLLRKRYLVGLFDGSRAILAVAFVVVSCLMVFYIFQSRLPNWAEVFYPIEYFFHKSVDLTGRTEIWQLVLLEINQHPWFGIGYGAFWLGEGSASQYIIDIMHWVPLQSHNGYIDIWNELGFAGLGLFAGVVVFHIYNLIRFIKIDREDAAIHWILFIFILISNISESELFRGVSFQNILFIVSSVAVSSRLTMHRMTRTEAAQPISNKTHGV